MLGFAMATASAATALAAYAVVRTPSNFDNSTASNRQLLLACHCVLVTRTPVNASLERCSSQLAQQGQACSDAVTFSETVRYLQDFGRELL